MSNGQDLVRPGEMRPVITVDHLPSRTNQSTELYFYTPYGTYVVYDVDGKPSTLHLVPGYWDEDSIHQNKSLDTDAELLGTYADYREAQRHMLLDLVRRYRLTPPAVDARLAPRIDADEDLVPPRLLR